MKHRVLTALFAGTLLAHLVGCGKDSSAGPAVAPGAAQQEADANKGKGRPAPPGAEPGSKSKAPAGGPPGGFKQGE